MKKLSTLVAAVTLFSVQAGYCAGPALESLGIQVPGEVLSAVTSRVPAPAFPAAAAATGVKRYAFSLRGKLNSWTRIFVQPAILSGTFEVVSVSPQAPRIQNLQADLKLAPAAGLTGYTLRLAADDGGYVEERKDLGYTLFKLKVPVAIDSGAVNTVLEETLPRSGGAVDAAVMFGFYCSTNNPGSCAGANWSRIGFNLQGSWVGDAGTDGLRLDVETSSLE